ncbi:hypothetical protein ACI2UO_11675 [Ralstonia nicotianae]
MLTDQQRASINALSDEELEYRLARGSASRFQRDRCAYLRVLRSQRLQARADAAQAAALKVAQDDGAAATRSGTHWAIAGWIVAGVIAGSGIVAVALFSK